jgi:hypothetical protein
MNSTWRVSRIMRASSLTSHVSVQEQVLGALVVSVLEQHVDVRAVLCTVRLLSGAYNVMLSVTGKGLHSG